MISIRAIFLILAGMFPVLAMGAAETNAVVSTAPVFVPDTSHSNDPLPDGVFAWSALSQTTEATNNQDFARFTFSFTNIAKKIEITSATNIVSTTNLTTITNSGFWARLQGNHFTYVTNIAIRTNAVVATNINESVPVTVLNVHASCGCTTVELPPVPWVIPGGSNGVIKINVNLAGKTAMPGMLFKNVNITTDKGTKRLDLFIKVLPPPPPTPLSEAERARGVMAATRDRQAVFKGDCASCHLPKIEGKYGQQLFTDLCAICHEANPRASMVPDLRTLPVTTSDEFWRTWITAGKPGTLMPAFATSQGGILNDMQIASIAAYLNSVNPPHAPAATNAPAK